MAQVNWRAFGEEVFADARKADKPVLLSLQAPWCQWCRAMNEQTFGNDAIAQYINDQFIAVKVDTDKRPDVNARYTQGGWPSTCLLTPDGDTMWGGTFVPPDGMAQLLPQVLNAYRNDKPGLAQMVGTQREQLKQQREAAPALDPNLPISPDIIRVALQNILFMFDFAHGGYRGDQNPAKFPHVDMTELVIEQYTRTVRYGEPSPDLQLVLDRTLTAMAEGGLRDEVDGGFFRYTQTPDWREPHHEKILEDNAALARLYARAYQATGNDEYKTIAESTLRYVDTVLYDGETGTWGGSQAADSEYYGQPEEERKEWNPPSVDATVLTGANAQAVRAHVAYWQATGDAASLAMAKRGLDFLIANLLKDEGALDHYHSTDAEAIELSGRIPSGLLSDSARTVAACLDLYEASQGVEYLDTAEAIAGWVAGHLEDKKSGGFYDAVTRPDAIGTLKYGSKDLNDNMLMADSLLRLFLATGEDEHAKLSQRVLQGFLPALGNLGYHAAGFALATERAILPPVLVHVLGSATDPATQALISAAHQSYRYERLVQPLDPSNEEDAEHIENLGYAKPTAPIAYICIANKCLDPISDPKELAELVSSAT